MEWLIILGIIAFFVYKYLFGTTSSFDIGEDGIVIKNKRILFTNILKIERDLSGYSEDRTMHFGYLITYTDDAMATQGCRLNVALTDRRKWEQFKQNVIAANPAIIINESIL